LVIDDRSEDLWRYVAWLVQLGATVQGARRLTEGRCFLEEWRPHVLVVDRLLPDADAFQELVLKSAGAAQAHGVVLTSGYFDKETYEAVDKTFAVPAPKDELVGPDVLAAFVQAALRRSAGAAPRQPSEEAPYATGERLRPTSLVEGAFFAAVSVGDGDVLIYRWLRVYVLDRRALFMDRPLVLQLRQFDILVHFLRHVGRPIGAIELVAKASRARPLKTAGSARVHVSLLRRAVDDAIAALKRDSTVELRDWPGSALDVIQTAPSGRGWGIGLPPELIAPAQLRRQSTHE
jgi:DNA-binding response OmpR family regulator